MIKELTRNQRVVIINGLERNLIYADVQYDWCSTAPVQINGKTEYTVFYKGIMIYQGREVGVLSNLVTGIYELNVSDIEEVDSESNVA